MKTERPPIYNPEFPPLYDINGIMKLLPHRPPFLFIDKIIDIRENGITGVKNVTMNEYFFIGHFPGEPVFPGVIQIEAMAQIGGIFIFNTVADPENYIAYFMKIEDAKFRKKVVPGDTIVFDLELLAPIRRNICYMHGKGWVAGQIVSEAKMMAQISRKNNI